MYALTDLTKNEYSLNDSTAVSGFLFILLTEQLFWLLACFSNMNHKEQMQLVSTCIRSLYCRVILLFLPAVVRWGKKQHD